MAVPGYLRLLRRFFGILPLFLLSLLSPESAFSEDATYLYTVQLNAAIQVTPPRITLTWQPDQYGVNNYFIYRKAKESTNWGNAIVTLPGSALSYTDTSVVVGQTYEYQVQKNAALGYTGYGYIFSGINAPLIDSRGKLLLIVATNSTASLSNELGVLQSDLAGDGWQVTRFDVSSNHTPAYVRGLITNAYYADTQNVSCVFLFGHVPILQSGNLNYDGHLARPMPADAYYGEMNNDWPTNAASSPGFLPSDVNLMVGRVDLANMPGNGAPVAWPNETELLRNYLNKDHRWRHGLVTVPRRALMGNLRGDENGEATAASGYRNFDPLVGVSNTFEANTEYGAPPEQRWVSILATNRYLWAYGCGAGQPTSVSGLGTNDGTFYDVWTTDIRGQDAKAVFVMLFGSWFGNWDDTDDILRSVLATPTLGLAACMAGRPHWYFHHMGLGETLGYGTRLSMNNTNLYKNESNGMTRAVYVALMGDPTLRQDPISPPSNFSVAWTPTNNLVNLAWLAPTNPIAGFHVYRATSTNGPFARLTTSLLTGTNYTDSPMLSGTYTYMVRAISLTTTPSGSYYNPSQGMFVTLPNFTPPIRLTGQPMGNSFALAWNSESGAIYQVQASTNGWQGIWTNLSSVTATNSISVWRETNFLGFSRRFYRVLKP